MNAKKAMKQDLARVLLAPLAALAVMLTSSAASAKGKPPPPPPPPPVDSGTIYFNYNNGSAQQVCSMKPDGTSQTALPVLNAFGAEPSRVLHGGKRWFVTLQTIPNEFYPPDPDGNLYARQELFAVSQRGEWFQLTDNPAIEAFDPRWTLGAGGVDGRITVVAYRWVQDANGKSISIEPGVYSIDVDPETWTSAPPAPQSPQRLDTILLPVACDAVGCYADVSGYDWSADGTHVVYAASDGLYVTRASDGTSGQLLSVSGAAAPRWSPVQGNGRTQILFGVGGGSAGRIDRVNDDGTGWVTMVPAGSTSSIWIIDNSARWSPSGTHLIYNQWTMDKKVWYRVKTSHVYRAAADGSGKIDLTTQMTFCYGLGWMNP